MSENKQLKKPAATEADGVIAKKAFGFIQQDSP